VKWFDAIVRSVRGGLDGLREWVGAKTRRRRPRIGYQRVEDFPDTLQAATLYVIGEEEYPWAAAMLCPCGCRDVIQLNLLTQARPCWTVRHHRNGSVSILPSVWRRNGCRSHFFVRNSGIEWYRPEIDGTGDLIG
jgi:hypothetical protein